MEYPNAGLVAIAESLGIRYRADYDPALTSASALMDLIEEKAKDRGVEDLQRVPRLPLADYRDLPVEVSRRVKKLHDHIKTQKTLLRLKKKGLEHGAVIALRGYKESQYRIERISVVGNSHLVSVPGGRTQMVSLRSLESRSKVMRRAPVS